MSKWLLRLKFEQDRQYRYKLHSKNVQRPKAREGAPEAPAQVQTVEILLDQRVVRVESDGSGHVTSISTPQVQGGENLRSVIYQHLGVKGETLLTSTPSQGSAFCFPEEAVEVGSTWQGVTQNQVPNVPTPITMTYSYKVEGMEKVGERECVRISFESDLVRFNMPLPDGSGLSQVTTSTQGGMFFDCEDGCLAKLRLVSTTHPRVRDMVFEVINESEQVLL